MIVVNFLILVAGFVALVKGADIFVDGSSALAKIFKVPGVIIGLTVVALGTSLPELAVSTTAALQGANEIALSNVIGSNIFNLLVVLGVCAVIHSVPVDAVIIRRDFPLSILTTAGLFIAVSFSSLFGGKFFQLAMADSAGVVSRPVGLVLLVIFICYIVYLIFDSIRHPVEEEEISDIPLWKALLFILIGILLIIAGGKAVVYSAQNIARFFGMTETLIGLTVVAIGTSLPELVTSIVAAKKGETSLAVGNVVGSNIFNLLFILGVSTSIHPVMVNAASVYDMMILLFVSTMTLFFSVTGHSIKRLEGIIMLLCYAGATAFAIIR